jgi:uncharacterized protein with HEPN domain
MSTDGNVKKDVIFVMHILESIDAVIEFSAGVTKKELAKSRLKRSAIVREIEVIGEASKNVSEGVKIRYSHVRWKEIAATRDKMIHHYFGVDLDILLAIVKKDIPKLRKEMLKIEKDLKKSGK